MAENRFDRMARETQERWTAAARKRGEDDAIAAASWTVDGNTKREAIPAVLAMADAGDPELYDYLPAMPDLSGEWADALTPSKLFEEITGMDAHAEASFNFDAYSACADALCEAYEDGVSATFEGECVRILRAAVEPEEDTSDDLASDHGHRACPDCGDTGVKMGANGYEQCTRFRSCWTD